MNSSPFLCLLVIAPKDQKYESSRFADLPWPFAQSRGLLLGQEELCILKVSCESSSRSLSHYLH